MSPAASRSLMAVGLVAIGIAVAWWLLQSDDVAPDRGPGVDQSTESPGPGTGDPPPEVDSVPAVTTTPYQERADHVAESNPATEPFGSLRIVATWEGDGAEAAHANIRVIPWSGPDPFLHALHRTADAAGVVVFPCLRIGRVGVYGFLGGNAKGAVEPGQETAIELKIPAGAPVAGVVVDAEDEPVSGASILLSREGSFTEVQKVGMSDAKGRFEIRGPGENHWRGIGARKAGYGPSSLRFLKGTGDKDVTLRLGAAGGGVSGIVVDSMGDPIPGTRVEIGPRKHRQFTLPDGGQGLNSAQFITRTDETGRFKIFGLAPGEVPALARAPGYAPWRDTVLIESKRTRELRIELLRGVIIEGKVLDAKGEPASRVDISVGGYGDFMTAWNRSGNDGTFRLVGVAPGEIKVKADGENRGEDEVTLHASDGETRHWSAQLKLGLILRGRVIDGAGKPLPEWGVSAEAFKDKKWDHKFLRTDEQGRFTTAGCLDAPYMLKVHRPKGGSFPILVVRNQKPDGQEILLRIENAHAKLGRITGTVLGPDGPLSGVHVNAWPAGNTSSPIVTPDADTGRFEIDQVPAGRYRLLIRADGYPRWSAKERELDPGETWDLGTIILQTPGFIKILAHRPATLPDVKLHAGLSAKDQRNQSFPIPIEGEARSKPLAPGKWTVSITGEGVKSTERSVEVRAGEDTTVEVEVTRGG